MVQRACLRGEKVWERGADELFAIFELGKNDRAGGGVEAQNGEFVDRGEGFGPEDFVGGAGGGDGAVVQENQLVGEGGAEVDVVGGEKHRELLFLCELAEEFEEIDLMVEV